MKKFIKPQLIIIIAFALCIVSCSKKDNAPTPPDTKTLLTSKIWSVIKLGSDENKNGIIDDAEFKPLPANNTDYVTFMSDGTVSVKYSDGKSTSNSVYFWELSDAQTIKVANLSHELSFYWHIKKLTTDQLNLDQYLADNVTLDLGGQFVPK